jgi:hypothetical protein
MDKKLSQEELSSLLAEAAKQVTVGADYLHYKNKRYKVLHLAIQESTNEVSVIYQATYGDKLIFARPLSSWIEAVELDNQKIPRFTKI